jgi:hypothetical protein
MYVREKKRVRSTKMTKVTVSLNRNDYDEIRKAMGKPTKVGGEVWLKAACGDKIDLQINAKKRQVGIDAYEAFKSAFTGKINSAELTTGKIVYDLEEVPAEVAVA